MTQTIGRRLKSEREQRRLTLDKVFEATRIRVQYLEALESDDLSIMPSSVQARGYLRNYAEYLGFDGEQMLNELRALSATHPPRDIIGPADEQPSNSPPNLQAVKSEPVFLSPAIPEIVDEAPAASEPLAAAANEVIVPVKPKTTRRKKSKNIPPMPLADAPGEPVTKRRGRKKAAPELPPVVQQDNGEEVAHRFEVAAQPERAADLLGAGEPILPPVEQEITRSQPVMQASLDVSDSLWQSWLNRVGSVLSARMRRRTLVPKEAPLAENEPPAPFTERQVHSAGLIQDPPLQNSDAIFKEIGLELRSRRELLSLHFDEVERNTHVKAHYLDALERGALDELPSTVQTRGMLSNYATFLDLDVDALLLRFADALQARHRERNPQKPPRKPGQPIVADMPSMRSFIAGDMIFGVGMAILLVGFAIWGVSRVMTIQSQQGVDPTAPSISDVLLASPDPASFTATSTFLPVEAFPGEPTVTLEIPTQNVNAEVQLNLVAVERSYMRVVVDGEVAFDGRVVPGNAYPFEAENQIEVLVGNGAAIRTVYNGRDLGLMGTFGQVVNNIYAGAEIITPTGAPSPTPTITLTPTRTAVPTSTLSGTSTSIPSPTAQP